MKNFLILVFLLSFPSAWPSIEYVPGEEGSPSATEIARNRACFDEVAKYGCGDPGEDLAHFRSCLHDAHPSLSDRCKRMMTTLYKRRD